MSPSTAKRLLDASIACQAIKDFTEGMCFSDYLGSKLHRAAVERQFEIIGEALNAASDAEETLVEMIPELPRIVGFRNRIIHGYDRVDDQLLWDIVSTKLPALADQLRHLLKDFQP